MNVEAPRFREGSSHPSIRGFELVSIFTMVYDLKAVRLWS